MKKLKLNELYLLRGITTNCVVKPFKFEDDKVWYQNTSIVDWEINWCIRKYWDDYVIHICKF